MDGLCACVCHVSGIGDLWHGDYQQVVNFYGLCADDCH